MNQYISAYNYACNIYTNLYYNMIINNIEKKLLQYSVRNYLKTTVFVHLAVILVDCCNIYAVDELENC